MLISSPPPSTNDPAPSLPLLTSDAEGISRDVLAMGKWIRCRAALGRRQVGVAVGLRNVIVVASLQPGAGIGVGGKGRWAAIAALAAAAR